MPTDLAGVLVVDPEPVEDERGLFARTWDPVELGRHGIDPHVAQCSVSWNRRAGTLRGLHFQRAPNAEAKLVRCTAGAMYDVALDLRPESPTHTRWVAVELTAVNRRALYIPPGCAHGFMSLVDDTEVYYQISVPYHSPATAGVRWDDPAFAVEWPRSPVVIGERDRAWPDYSVGGPA